MKGILKNLKELKTARFWKTTAIDGLFLISAVVFAVILNQLSKLITNLWTAIAFLLIYFLGLISIYCFFKIIILRVLAVKIKKKYAGFFLFNLLFLTLTSFSVLLIYLIINYFVRLEFQRYYFGIILLIMLIISYIMLNMMQMLNAMGREIWEALPVIKKDLLKMLLLLIAEFLGILLIYLIYLSIFNMMGSGADINWIFQTITLLAIFCYNSFNRIVFLKAVRQN